MAERRMFAKSIVLSDAFLDMPMSSRCLYFTLGMLADDDGFVGNPKSIMRQCGASQDDMAVLLQKRYVLGFDSGVIVIKHWRMNNYLQRDRRKDTTYIEEKATLTIDEKGAYTEAEKPMYTECIQTVYTGKDSIGKDSIGKDIERKHFVPPSVEEVKAYIDEKGYSINPDSFVDYYTSNGWHVGRNKMKDWKACVRSWNNREKKPTKPSSQIGRAENYDDDTMKKMLLSSL